MIESISGQEWPTVLYESPHRIIVTLEALREVLGDRETVIGREMTKLHEEIFRGTLSEAIDYFEKPRGEFTIVVAG